MILCKVDCHYFLTVMIMHNKERLYREEIKLLFLQVLDLGQAGTRPVLALLVSLRGVAGRVQVIA